MENLNTPKKTKSKVTATNATKQLAKLSKKLKVNPINQSNNTSNYFSRMNNQYLSDENQLISRGAFTNLPINSFNKIYLFQWHRA